ncbi:uncharacterized protein LOC113235013 [Hyposmocoma kahamanoa]|uniref:uncharacterized protein LOC113235013 n=1 Tax=Hyposmocoma kahamanoa TaxID=1477025 RepID=UPI000E6D6790|nr:uncharacterized protein LOC113235013 [Hyposmocoma kahamanoa]
MIADPTYYKRDPIDILLGAEEYSKILLQGFEKLENGIIAQNTELGWILSGFRSTEYLNGMKIISLMTRTEETQQLTKFWELEEVTSEYQLKEEDQICEKYYTDTTQRNSDGTYTVRLPLKDPSIEYGNTRQKAVARLIQLEKKLDKNHDLRQKYNEFMNEYLEMGHMTKVVKSSYYEGKYYIPHQPVIREDAITTKLRCVFDASSKSSTNISLNDNMHKGPRLQQDLETILLRWRKHKFAFMADIEKMCRFIKIHKDDLSYQRILWRWTPRQPIEEYELTTVTYGTTAAPYLATKTLQQLAKDERQNYPDASRATLQDFYVDDILSGNNDLEKTKLLQKQLLEMLRAGGFNLRKWSSNSTELLEDIPDEYTDDKMIKLPLDETRKSLGVIWSPYEDNFQFKINVTIKENPTKRFILSEIAKLFDPHGWLQPVIITLKLLIQELGISGIGWNVTVPEEINKKWLEIQNQLKCIENIKIPRWIYYTETEVELHGFSDASEKAYGAVVYCRIKVNGSYHVTLLQAKTKVAPEKHKTTLPRLELCAAVLLTNLIRKVKTAIDCEQTTINCWTDSMITLGWIRGEADKWQTFVANRVSEIQRTLPQATWNHVASADNPADIISRGIEPNKLQTSQRLRAMVAARRLVTQNSSSGQPADDSTEQQPSSRPATPIQPKTQLHIYAGPAVRKKSTAPQLYELKAFS